MTAAPTAVTAICHAASNHFESPLSLAAVGVGAIVGLLGAGVGAIVGVEL